jgi:hypothetical protein
MLEVFCRVDVGNAPADMVIVDRSAVNLERYTEYEAQKDQGEMVLSRE